jgi:hypothetical protein
VCAVEGHGEALVAAGPLPAPEGLPRVAKGSEACKTHALHATWTRTDGVRVAAPSGSCGGQCPSPGVMISAPLGDVRAASAREDLLTGTGMDTIAGGAEHDH